MITDSAAYPTAIAWDLQWAHDVVTAVHDAMTETRKALFIIALEVRVNPRTAARIAEVLGESGEELTTIWGQPYEVVDGQEDDLVLRPRVELETVRF